MRAWRFPAIVLLVGVLAVLGVIFARLGDGSYDCPGNALQLSRNPLPEDNPPPDGFYADPACNRAARERMKAMPWTVAGSLGAVAASVAFTVGRRRYRR
jgi:hypothetical protein